MMFADLVGLWKGTLLLAILLTSLMWNVFGMNSKIKELMTAKEHKVTRSAEAVK